MTRTSRVSPNQESDQHRSADTADVKVLIEGVAFDALDEASVVSRVMQALSRGEGGCLVTPNVDILRKLQNPEHAGIARDADLVVADGMPVVWASRLQRQPLPGRVAGSDLVWSLTRAAAEVQRSVFLLGGDDGVAQRAAERLRSEVTDSCVAGWHFPPYGFESEPAEQAAIVAALKSAAPDIVYVGLGFPRQEILMIQLAQRFPKVWFVGCGASITMMAGEVSRAPAAAQNLGLEWAHRLAKEPRRLGRRYLVDDAPYAAAMLGRAIRQRRRRPRTRQIA